MNPFSADRVADVVRESMNVKQSVLDHCCTSIVETGMILADCAQRNNMMLFCGNGGSAADSQHIACELVVRFRSGVDRRAIPALALTVDPSVATAGGNDYGFENVFARGVEAFGKPGSVLVGISTSGNSENVLRAVRQAKRQDMQVIGLLGADGGKIASECDSTVIVPSSVTARIQESHIMIGHIWCEIIEERLFPEHFVA